MIIELKNGVKVGVEVTPLEFYPDNEKHMECRTHMPFTIKKGEDGYFYHEDGKEYSYNVLRTENKWIVHLKEDASPSLQKIFKVKKHKDLNVILNYCSSLYFKSLKLEIKRYQGIIKEKKI